MTLEHDVSQYEALTERMVTAYRARIMKVCKAGDLTPPQFFALHTIARLRRTKMSPLADELGLSMGAASTLIDRLVTRGLVERDADASDRRAVYVSLSDKGRDVLAEAMQARREILQQVFGHLPAAKRRLVLDGLAAIVEAWEALPPIDGPLAGCSDE